MIKSVSSAQLVLSVMISISIMSSMNMVMDYLLIQRAVLVHSQKTQQGSVSRVVMMLRTVSVRCDPITD